MSEPLCNPSSPHGICAVPVAGHGRAVYAFACVNLLSFEALTSSLLDCMHMSGIDWLHV